jgi:hypothetical protein
MQQRQECMYTAPFPVDEWDRLGGQYSLADVPVKAYRTLTRSGQIISKDSPNQLFEIEDKELKFTIVVPMTDVRDTDIQ